MDALGTADAEELENKIRSYLIRSGQAASLQEWGAKREELPHLAELGMTKGRADNNPAPLDPATILSILEQIYPDTTYQIEQKGA